jgi:hypothetical protein
VGGLVSVTLDRLGGAATASWFDPITGTRRPAGRLSGAGTHVVKAPGAGQDWVLLLRAAAARRS